MALIPGWYPPTRENYETLLLIWKFFPLVASLQWAISWYGMGKTSQPSRLNLPGRVAWLLMECPGFLTLLYTLSTLPSQSGSVPFSDLPYQNKILASLFVIHYLYRAVAFPFLQPSMAPLHVLVCLFAAGFQLMNGTLIGSWLAAYGPTTQDAWARQSSTLQFACGIALFYLGLMANYYHDEELREIRRRENARRERVEAAKGAGKAERHYAIPQAGLFKVMLYPHYFVEWIEWTGFWIACGLRCQPAMMFVVNEVAAMLPRAVRGKKWYEDKFGREKIKGRWAVIPGVI